MTQIPEKPDVQERPNKNRPTDILIALLLLMAVVALVIFGLQGFRMQQLQFRIQQEWLQGQQSGFSLLQSAMVTNQRALTLLVRATQSPEEEWALAESRYLLQLANVNLTVLHDVPTATALLVAADSTIGSLKSPTWIPVRRAVEKNLVQLRHLPQVDVAKLTGKIRTLSQQIPQLALPPSQTKPAAQTEATDDVATDSHASSSTWERGVAAGLQTLKKAVVVKQHPQNIQSLQPDAQRLSAVRNIQLKLAAAEWAVLQQQDKVYQASLTAAKDLIEKTFNQDADLTQRVLRSIDALAQVRLQPKVPDIAASLNALDAALAQRAKQSRE